MEKERWEGKMGRKDEKGSRENEKFGDFEQSYIKDPQITMTIPLGRDMQSPHRSSSTGSTIRSDWAWHGDNGQSPEFSEPKLVPVIRTLGTAKNRTRTVYA